MYGLGEEITYRSVNRRPDYINSLLLFIHRLGRSLTATQASLYCLPGQLLKPYIESLDTRSFNWFKIASYTVCNPLYLLLLINVSKLRRDLY
jgi:hypothetical protein